MKITAEDLERLGVVDEIVPEPMGGAHTDYAGTARAIGEAIRRHLGEISAWGADDRIRRRREKYRRMGAWKGPDGSHPPSPEAPVPAGEVDRSS